MTSLIISRKSVNTKGKIALVNGMSDEFMGWER